VTEERKLEGIFAKEIIISPSAVVDEDVKIRGLDGNPAERVVIGDHTHVRKGFRAALKSIEIGDWCTINGPCTVYGYETVSIGHCCWIGQDVVLNCNAPLNIGRGCILSSKCNIWTHFTGGDTVEGCRYHSTKPATLGDDVWLGVGVTVAPVNIGAKSLVLSNAAVTHDIPPNRVYGGVPARDLTEKMGAPFEEISAAEKLERLRRKFEEFKIEMAAQGRALDFSKIRLTDGAPCEIAGVSTFSTLTRTYSKIGTEEETAFMRFLIPQIKFYPAGK